MEGPVMVGDMEKGKGAEGSAMAVDLENGGKKHGERKGERRVRV
jgi:hypothetical protein